MCEKKISFHIFLFVFVFLLAREKIVCETFTVFHGDKKSFSFRSSVECEISGVEEIYLVVLKEDLVQSISFIEESRDCRFIFNVTCANVVDQKTIAEKFAQRKFKNERFVWLM